jgi:hypothetical protein
MINKNCTACNKPIDSHYDYSHNEQGEMIGDGYTPCLELVLDAVAFTEIERLNNE